MIVTLFGIAAMIGVMFLVKYLTKKKDASAKA